MGLQLPLALPSVVKMLSRVQLLTACPLLMYIYHGHEWQAGCHTHCLVHQCEKQVGAFSMKLL